MAPVTGSSSTRRASFSSVAPEAVARPTGGCARPAVTLSLVRPRSGTSGTATASAPSASRWLGRVRPRESVTRSPARERSAGRTTRAPRGRASVFATTTPGPAAAGVAPGGLVEELPREPVGLDREGPLVLPLGHDVRPVRLRDAGRRAPRVLVPQQHLPPRLLGPVPREARAVCHAPEAPRPGPAVAPPPGPGSPRPRSRAPRPPSTGSGRRASRGATPRTAARTPRRGPGPSRSRGAASRSARSSLATNLGSCGSTGPLSPPTV